MKSINWKKGIFRLTLVLSILNGFVLGYIANYKGEDGPLSQLFLFFVVFFGLTWLVYFSVRFVVRGFKNKD